MAAKPPSPVLALLILIWLFAPAPRAAAASPPSPKPRRLTHELSALMPKGAFNITGGWSLAGGIANGEIWADVAGTHGCGPNGATGRIHIELSGRVAAPDLPASVTHAADDGWLEEALTAMDGEAQRLPVTNSLHLGLTPVKVETVSTGRMIYFDHTSACAESTRPMHTQAQLKALARRDQIAVRIEIHVESTAEEARALGADILARIAKTDFPAALE